MDEKISHNNIRKLWKIAQEIVDFDITATDALAKFQMIQRRTEDILANRALRVGNPYNLEQARRLSAASRKIEADKFAKAINAAIDYVVKEQGAKSNREIADALNKMGVRPIKAPKWTPLAIFRMRKKVTSSPVK